MLLNVYRYSRLVEDYNNELQLLDSSKTGIKEKPEKWTKKEVLGHLIDSAINNYTRFVNLQYNPSLGFTRYDQDKWVEIRKYNESNWDEIRTTWYLLNKAIVYVISTIPEERYKDEVRGGEEIIFKEPENCNVTTEYLISDYYDHLGHHMKTISGQQ